MLRARVLPVVAAMLLTTTSLAAVATSHHLSSAFEREMEEGSARSSALADIENERTMTPTTKSKTHQYARTLRVHHHKSEPITESNIFDHSSQAKVEKEVVASKETATPTLRFSVRVGLVPARAREPNEVDRLALLCQLHRYVQQRLRDKTGDQEILSNLHQLDWNYSNATSTWQVQFGVHSTFGHGPTISPWTLVKVLELPRRDIELLVKNYVWPLNTTIFANTRTFFFGGQLGFPKHESFQMAELPLRTCPPAPPLPPPLPTSSPSELDPLGLQTEVPRESETIEGNTLFLVPQAQGKNEELHAASSLTHVPSRSLLTISVHFWVANDQDIRDASLLQSQWLEPSFPMLVESMMASSQCDSHTICHQPIVDNNTPHIVPNSSRIVQVHPMVCPLPAATLPAGDWHCHQVVASYDLDAGDNLTIPFETSPGRYTRSIQMAIQSGLYQAMMRQRIDPNLPFKIGNDVESLQYSWWQSSSSTPQNAFHQHYKPTLIWIGTCLGVFFLVLLAALVGMEVYYRHKVRVLQEQRDDTLWELQGLLLAEPPALPG